MPTLKPALLLPRKRAKKRSARWNVPGLERLEDRLTPASITLDATVRDFQTSHPDFEPPNAPLSASGLVRQQLGADGKPVFVAPNGSGLVTSASTFNQWYRDVSG